MDGVGGEPTKNTQNVRVTDQLSQCTGQAQHANLYLIADWIVILY